jgi:hypothetical protein
MIVQPSEAPLKHPAHSLRLPCGLLVGTLLVAMSPGPSSAQSRVFGPDLRVNHSGDTFHQEAPQVAVCLDGSIVVVWEDWRHTSGSVYIARSTDGGATFSVEQRVDPASLPGYGEPILVQWPGLAVDGQGIVYVTWIAWVLGETRRVWCARSLDDGQTFGEPVPVSDTMEGDRSWPATAGDPWGGVYVVWGDFRNGPEVLDLYVSRSDDGSVFSPNVKANLGPISPNCTAPLPDIAAGHDPGRVYLCWRQTNASILRYVYSSRSTDFGVTWQPFVEVSHVPWSYDG